MELFAHLATGFGVALTPDNFLYCLLGATFGTLVGVLPGIGPLTTIAMLLPLTPETDGVMKLLGATFFGWPFPDTAAYPEMIVEKVELDI